MKLSCRGSLKRSDWQRWLRVIKKGQNGNDIRAHQSARKHFLSARLVGVAAAVKGW